MPLMTLGPRWMDWCSLSNRRGTYGPTGMNDTPSVTLMQTGVGGVGGGALHTVQDRRQHSSTQQLHPSVETSKNCVTVPMGVCPHLQVLKINVLSYSPCAMARSCNSICWLLLVFIAGYWPVGDHRVGQ